MYHRIADEPLDHWRIAVSPARFEEQLSVLRRTRHPLPLNDFVRRLLTNTLPPNAVALTFDDGYFDNLSAGKPRLAAADIPATVFLTTGFVGRPGEYWWDELVTILLTGTGPQHFELSTSDETMSFNLGLENGVESDASSGRRAALTTIWRLLRCLEDGQREAMMIQLRSKFVTNHHSNKGRAMTCDEVRALISDGLVTIGAHTVTHPVLSSLKDEASRHEILESKRACEAMIDQPVTSFAYPYGDFDERARDAVKFAGFIFACSTQQGPVVGTSNLFTLPRINVQNWGGYEFERALGEY